MNKNEIADFLDAFGLGLVILGLYTIRLFGPSSVIVGLISLVIIEILTGNWRSVYQGYSEEPIFFLWYLWDAFILVQWTVGLILQGQFRTTSTMPVVYLFGLVLALGLSTASVAAAYELLRGKRIFLRSVLHILFSICACFVVSFALSPDTGFVIAVITAIQGIVFLGVVGKRFFR